MPKKKKEEVVIDSQATKIIEELNTFKSQSQVVRQKWGDCYQSYKSIAKKSSPFLANLYIPKTHEAVELLAAFLIGNNQSISASPESKDDVQNAMYAEKYLDYLWRRPLRMRPKLLTWLKQGVLFGNGIMKVVWEEDEKEVCISIPSVTDIYFDYYTQDIQDSPVIHAITKTTEELKEDEKYDAKDIVANSEIQDTSEQSFDATDMTVPSNNETTLYEYWNAESDRVITVAPTAYGWKVIRDMENPYKDENGNYFKPFVKLRFKNNPLPNRAYDIGAIEPTLELQMAFNDAVNEFFDNVTLINNKVTIKRRGANVSPLNLVRKPGQIIEVDNIETDLKWDEVSDVKASLLELIKFLDGEYQQASMVVNILKGIPNAEFATEVVASQNNVQTILDMIQGNIVDALSDVGNMILTITFQHINKIDSIKVLDTDERVQFVEGIKAKDIIGQYDIKVRPDRPNTIPKVVKAKQALDLIAIVNGDPMLVQKYPNLKVQLIKEYLRENGNTDIESFFKENTEQQNPEPQMSGGKMPTRFSGLTPQANESMAMGDVSGTQVGNQNIL